MTGFRFLLSECCFESVAPALQLAPLEISSDYSLFRVSRCRDALGRPKVKFEEPHPQPLRLQTSGPMTTSLVHAVGAEWSASRLVGQWSNG
jgi:hypothetical protein